jgi:hypothetical protein
MIASSTQVETEAELSPLIFLPVLQIAIAYKLSILQELSKLKIILTRSKTYPPLTEAPPVLAHRVLLR